MARIGGYVAAHNNPLFLRLTLLQILAQTVKPHVVAVHQNNHYTDYLWAVEDLIPVAQVQGIQVINIHNPQAPRPREWFAVPIRRLLDEGCDYFFKFDHDDIYYSNHVARLLEFLTAGYDYVINKVVGKLVLAPGKPYDYDPHCDFGQIHSPGGMSGSVAFSRRFAIQNLRDLESETSGMDWEDNITTQKTLSSFAGNVMRLTDQKPTTCYVAYGGNASSAHWACFEWCKQNRHLFAEG